jgi:hypothetical protein
MLPPIGGIYVNMTANLMKLRWNVGHGILSYYQLTSQPEMITLAIRVNSLIKNGQVGAC